MGAVVTNFDSLWREASSTLRTLSGKTWTSQSEPDPGIALLQAVAYKVLSLDYQGRSLRDQNLYLRAGMSSEQALTTSPIACSDYRRLVLDEVDGESKCYRFRDAYIEKAATFGALKCWYVPSEVFSTDTNHKKAIQDIFRKNRGFGEVAPDVEAAVALKVSITVGITTKSSAITLNERAQYNTILQFLDHAITPPPVRDELLDGALIEGPEVQFPNVTHFQPAIKKVSSGFRMSITGEFSEGDAGSKPVDLQEELDARLEWAQRTIGLLPFVQSVTCTGAVNGADKVAEGKYVFFSIKKGNTKNVSVEVLFNERKIEHAADTGSWSEQPLKKADAKPFLLHFSESDKSRSNAPVQSTPTLMDLLAPPYREGGEQWSALVQLFDAMLDQLGGNHVSIRGLLDKLGSKSGDAGRTNAESVEYMSWLIDRLGGADFAGRFEKERSHTNPSLRKNKHVTALRKFLPDLLLSMKERNLGAMTGSSLQKRINMAIGEGWAGGWRASDFFVVDYSYFSTSHEHLHRKALSLDIIGKFSFLYEEPAKALEELKKILKLQVPMHIHCRYLDVSASNFDEAKKVYEAGIKNDASVWQGDAQALLKALKNPVLEFHLDDD